MIHFIFKKKTQLRVSIIKQYTIPVTADRKRAPSGVSFDFSPLWASDYVLRKHTILQNRSKKSKDTPSRFFITISFAVTGILKLQQI